MKRNLHKRSGDSSSVKTAKNLNIQWLIASYLQSALCVASNMIQCNATQKLKNVSTAVEITLLTTDDACLCYDKEVL